MALTMYANTFDVISGNVGDAQDNLVWTTTVYDSLTPISLANTGFGQFKFKGPTIAVGTELTAAAIASFTGVAAATDPFLMGSSNFSTTAPAPGFPGTNNTMYNTYVDSVAENIFGIADYTLFSANSAVRAAYTNVYPDDVLPQITAIAKDATTGPVASLELLTHLFKNKPTRFQIHNYVSSASTITSTTSLSPIVCEQKLTYVDMDAAPAPTSTPMVLSNNLEWLNVTPTRGTAVVASSIPTMTVMWNKTTGILTSTAVIAGGVYAVNETYLFAGTLGGIAVTVTATVASRTGTVGNYVPIMSFTAGTYNLSGTGIVTGGAAGNAKLSVIIPFAGAAITFRTVAQNVNTAALGNKPVATIAAVLLSMVITEVGGGPASTAPVFNDLDATHFTDRATSYETNPVALSQNGFVLDANVKWANVQPTRGAATGAGSSIPTMTVMWNKTTGVLSDAAVIAGGVYVVNETYLFAGTLGGIATTVTATVASRSGTVGNYVPRMSFAVTPYTLTAATVATTGAGNAEVQAVITHGASPTAVFTLIANVQGNTAAIGNTPVMTISDIFDAISDANVVAGGTNVAPTFSAFTTTEVSMITTATGQTMDVTCSAGAVTSISTSAYGSGFTTTGDIIMFGGGGTNVDLTIAASKLTSTPIILGLLNNSLATTAVSIPFITGDTIETVVEILPPAGQLKRDGTALGTADPKYIHMMQFVSA